MKANIHRILPRFLRAPVVGAGLLVPFALAGSPVAVAAGVDTLAQATAMAQEKLDATLKDLAAVRETISGEKVPLTRELSQLQEELSSLRRDYDKARNAVDTRTLELTNLRNETKARQDEIAYLGTLLDEYARGFEGRIHPGELPRYASVIEAATLAPQNKDLSPREKLERQMKLVKDSLGRLGDLIGGVRIKGTAVDPQGLLASGTFAFIGPVALFAADTGKIHAVECGKEAAHQNASILLDGNRPDGVVGPVG